MTKTKTYNHSQYAYTCTGPNPFIADGEEQSDINYLVDRFLKTGDLPSSRRQPTYMEHPQQDLNTVLSKMRQLQHDEVMGYGAQAPSQDALDASVTDDNNPTHGSVSSEPIVQPEADQADPVPSATKQTKKVSKS